MRNKQESGYYLLFARSTVALPEKEKALSEGCGKGIFFLGKCKEYKRVIEMRANTTNEQISELVFS